MHDPSQQPARTPGGYCMLLIRTSPKQVCARSDFTPPPLKLAFAVINSWPTESTAAATCSNGLKQPHLQRRSKVLLDPSILIVTLAWPSQLLLRGRSALSAMLDIL